MAILKTKIKSDGETFKGRKDKMYGLLEDLNIKLNICRDQGPEKYQTRHKDKGKMLARDRVELLLDSGTEFLELMPMAGYEQKEMTNGASIIGGIGVVGGKKCVINANVPTLKGGALNYMSVLKSQRLDIIAKENRLPTIYLTESAGADLPQQSLVYNIGGASFREISRRSAMGIPSIAVVFGSSTAGGAYIPGMSDYVIMVKKNAKVFLAGPPLVKMATNEDTTDELLGGAEMHSRISGVSDFLAENEQEAIELAKELVSQFMPQGNGNKTLQLEIKDPLYESEELLGIVSTDLKRQFDIKEVIARVVDGSEFLEFKPNYGPTLVTGYAKIMGHSVGILANNGVLFSEASNKGTQFIQLCNQENRPLIFLQNITGFMVGSKIEQGGIIKHGAKLINAVSNSQVPAITILIGASYGAGNYAMCGRAFEPRFLFTWPNSNLAVMGAEQLAGVLEIIKRESSAKAGIPINEDEIKDSRLKTIEHVQYQSSAYYGSSRIWDDGIIDPRDTRKILGECLSVINLNPEKPNRQYGVFRM